MPEIPDSKVHEHPHKRRSNPKPTISKDRGGAGPITPLPHCRITKYAELAVTSNFTFLTGASHPDEYIYQAAALGYGAIAITDRNSLAGVIRAHVAAKDAGISFIVGCRLELAESSEGNISNSTSSQADDEQKSILQVLVYPTSRAAYGRLCRLLTLGKRRTKKGECLLTLDDLLEYQEGLLAVVLLHDAMATSPHHHIAASLARLRMAFDDDRLSLAISRLYGPSDEKYRQRMEAFSAEFNIPLVAVNDVYYHIPDRRQLQDVMTCVRSHCTLAEAGFRLFPNGERYLKEPQEMARLFADHPEAIARTMKIAERTAGVAEIRNSKFEVQRKRQESTKATRRQEEAKTFEPLPPLVPPARGNGLFMPSSLSAGFSLDQLRYEYPHETCPPGKAPMEHLIELTWQGAVEHYPQGVPEKVRKQIEHEFELIEELQYAPYFLTVHDLVRFARSRGILCQGRGAAANSAVCYCLGVTAVDPDRINLLFERFVSRERNEPPDIDIDFEHERREEVIQYIYEKYGRDRAGLTAEVITYRRRSAVRDVGKALGLSLDAVDRIAKRVDHWELNPFADSDEGDVPAQLAALGFDPADATVRHLIRLVDEIAGFPRHLSQHVGGFVMTEGLLCESVPIENAAMKDRTVIEWDKDDIEALGMLKVDVLGLGMLTCLSKALELIHRHEGMKNDSHEATKPRSHEGNGKERHGGTNGRRDEGIETSDVATKPRSHEGRNNYVQQCQNVSRLDCMAEGNAACKTGLLSDGIYAGKREIRLDGTNEAGSGVNPVEYCGGTRTAELAGLHSVSQDSSGLADGVTNSTSSIRRAKLPAHSSDVRRTASRNRSSSSGADSEPGKTFVAAPSTIGGWVASQPSWLRGLVAPWLSLTSIPAEDPIVYDMLCKADTIGVFQVESRAQMTMLPRLRPKCFYDLVIEVAIVRPGPIIGDMVHPYLRRRNGEEKFSYPSPVIEEVLGKTLGVPLFQEQVMSLAIRAAGFTAGEAERLRRAITAWTSKDDIAKYPAQFIEGMIRNGYDREFATWCFERMKGFSQYGFPESHAASFALLVYASAWIKCYHPAAFAAALLNSQPMGFYAPAQIIRDAQDHGVTVLPADVNYSEWDCTLEEGTKEGMHRKAETQKRGNAESRTRVMEVISNLKSEISNLKLEISNPLALRLGMRVLRGLREADAKKIVETVRKQGPFATPFELWQKSGVSASTYHCLALGDAFGSMSLDRQHALWEVQRLHGKPLPLFDKPRGNKPTGQQGNEDKEQEITILPHYHIATSPELLPEIPYSHQVAADYRIIGFSLKDHPLSFLREMLAERGVLAAIEAKDEIKSPFGRRVTVAGLVLFRQRPGTARGVMFMTLEDETGRIDLIVRPSVYEKFRDAAVYSKLALARGRVERHNGVVHVLATAFESLDHLATGLPSQSRDFR
jgi:error-prone DNA polymerase